MDEETEYRKLPVDERCVHKLWKARIDGYEETIKIFHGIDDEKSPEWNKFIGLIKKFVIDSHAMAQEKGLEATLIFVENCAHAGKTVGEVMSGIVTKCVAAQKTKTKELALQVTLMYIEIERQEAVLEELIKGMEHKNPKIVAACAAAITQALREFGNKVVQIKPLVKKISPLLSDRDKAVRDEGKLMTVEMYRWIGAALKPQLTSLTSVLLTELESEFDKLKGGKAEPTRYLKSQQEKQKILALSGSEPGDDNGGDENGENGADEEIDPLDLIDPVDILSKLPKDFYDKLEEKKWQDRKEALEALDTLLQNPKLEGGDYGDLVRALKKVLTKDSNVVLVTLAGKCLAALARGLGKKFTPYATVCISAVLEKFKEKKASVVAALRDAIDAAYPATTMEAIQEDILEALNNKNPSVKAETASFLARAFTKTLPTVFNKKLLKALTAALLKTLNEPDPTVRDCSAEALGTALKLLGDKTIGLFLADVDPLKMAKIKECSEKAIITVKIVAPKKERPASAPSKQAVAPRGGTLEPKPVKRPATSAGKKSGIRKPGASSGNTAGPLSKSASSSKVPPSERDMSPEEIDERSSELLTSDIINGISDANWKSRLSSVESYNNFLDTLEVKGQQSQVLIRFLLKKPGLKDTNFQVLKIKLEIIKKIVDTFGIGITTTDYIINDITEKLGDPKNSSGAAETLTAIAESIRLEFVVSKVLSFAFEQKSPKVQSESLIWLSNAIKEFGFQINPKLLIDDVKKGVQSTNPTVRQAAISLLGVIHLYMGNSLMIFFDNEKPALKQQIQAEFDKYSDQKPPPPIRGSAAKKDSSPYDENEEDDAPEEDQQQMNMVDMLSRVDISPQITEALLNEMSDKNWKTRNEGLIKLQGMLNDAKLIKPSIGDLPQALAHRLVDSNAKIAQTALAICQQLAEAMGPSCKQYVRVLFPGFLNGLGDSKSFIRSACITCINQWGDQCGYKEFFDGEMIADALKSGSPALRTELWSWLAEKVPTMQPKTIPKEELLACLPQLYGNICDRNADVRKNANEAILGVMIHLGYDQMVKALERQKPTSKKEILVALDKARPNLPMKPLPKNKQQAPVNDDKPGKSVAGGSNAAGKAAAPKSAIAKANATSSSRKKEEEIDTSPLLAVNNTKNQRFIDEQKLKVLKWTFTQPREEFTDLLRDQMMTANVNKGLMANMFHDDFRYHLKAIESLLDDLPTNSRALICNLDLILKWLSLRLYDTNPSVLLKGLDYLGLVFQMLIDNKYILGENEGSCFIPHLLIKIGDPKDAVRNGVRSLFRQMCMVYPYTKVFAYIMEGLKSKNARQRTECLDELSYLIETYDMSVCQPSPAIALKEIAKHISDRDNSVRSAALNCVVQAYFLTGERVYKLIGQLNEKDLSMLDERIKRAKKTRKVEVPSSTTSGMPVTSTNQMAGQSKLARPESVVICDAEDDITPDEIVDDQTPVVTRTFDTPLIRPSRPSGPFGLDPMIVAEIEKDWVRGDNMELKEIKLVDLSFANKPLNVVPFNGVTYPADRLHKLISDPAGLPPLSSTMPSAAYGNFTISPQSANYARRQQACATVSSPTNFADVLPPAKLDPNLVRMIRSIGSTDLLTARAALNELNDIVAAPEKQAVLRDYEEMFIESIYIQFKNLSQIPLTDSLIMYQPVLATTYSFFSKALGKNIGIESLKKLMSVLLQLMADQKLPNGEEGQYNKVINGICLRILDRTNFSHLNCALIRLLREVCSGAALPKFTDLVMKCIWRNVKAMPERGDELDYSAILYEAHEFMAALPSSWWSQRPIDTPMRTIKTVVHNLGKIKGTAILQHLQNIPQHSELHTYLIRVLKNVQKDEHGSNLASPQRSNSGNQLNLRRFSRQNQEAITNIFKLISGKESREDGLTKLYEFKTKNPDVEIDSFMKGNSPQFKKYVEDGLLEIERNLTANAANDNQCNTILSRTSNWGNNNNNNVLTENRFCSSKGKLDPDYWLERFNAIRNDSPAQSDFQSDNNKDSVENINVPQKVNALLKRDIPEPLSSIRREAIQQKLEQIRQQKT